MTNSTCIDTIQHLDNRFASGTFGAAGGNIQSLLFMTTVFQVIRSSDALRELFKKLSEWTMMPNGDVRALRIKVHDWGCAEGDGTAYIKVMLPAADVVGFDVSAEAISRAKARWPTVDDFQVGDVTNPTEDAHIIFCSHVIEHFTNPVEIIETLTEHCELLIVIVPPLQEGLMGGHDGGVPFDEWIDDAPERIIERRYTTLRYYPDYTYSLPEANVMLVFDGKIKP